MKILLTGATGVVGTGLIPELLKRGHQIRLLSRSADKHSKSLLEGTESISADIARPEELAGAAEECECVIHISGIAEEEPPEVTFQKVNVEGTRNMLGAVAPSRPFFIYLSSLGADRGKSEYHKSKIAAEELVRAYPGPWLILRPGNVYGPGDAVISVLLKMVESLPAVPVVEDGEQPFQPIWHVDLGRAIAQALDRRDLAGQTLELAGPEVTTTNDLLDRFARITGRDPARIPVATWVADFATKAAESLGGLGAKTLKSFGLGLPLNQSKLHMLLEKSVIEDPSRNALLATFEVQPTRLQQGLERLVDSLPEQMPAEGVGSVEHKKFWTEIAKSRRGPEELVDLFCRQFGDVLPIDVKRERQSEAEPGKTIAATLPGRGEIQVRLVEKTERQATFLTLEGHPLAGMIRVSAEPVNSRVRFVIETFSRASNAVDWVAMQTVGRFMQNANWKKTIRRVVELSGGTMLRDVESESAKLDDEQEKALTTEAERLVENLRRDDLAKEVNEDRSREEGLPSRAAA